MNLGEILQRICISITFIWIQVTTITGGLTTTMTKVSLPEFHLLKKFYPGYKHQLGRYNNHHLIKMIGCDKSCQKRLLHDTSALRLSHALNKIGGVHSLGKTLIHLSKYGQDSVNGLGHLQYIFHPIAYGPYLADKYGYPTISKMHATDPIHTMKKFFGKQGILQIITYTKKDNKPIGHIALWDCTHFHQSKNWIAGHEFITLEFWESPDSNCPNMEKPNIESYYSNNDPSDIGEESAKHLRHKAHNKHKGSRRYQHLLRLAKMKMLPKYRHHRI